MNSHIYTYKSVNLLNEVLEAFHNRKNISSTKEFISYALIT